MGHDIKTLGFSVRRRTTMPVTLRHQRGILGRIFGGGGLAIEIKSQSFSFDTVDDFKLFLSAKTEIPSSKMQEMLKRSEQHLKEEIKQLKIIETTINEKLASTIRDPKTIDSYLDDATMVRFSQDYDWRQIMFELSKKSTDYSEYKLEAVAYYMKYLRSRVEIAESILRERYNVKSDNSPSMIETVDTKALTDNYAEYIRKEGESGKEEDEKKLFVSTSHIDLSDKKEEEEAVPSELKRIPRGKTVTVDISTVKDFPVKIASRKFVITVGDKIELVSKKGDIYPIELGENLVGRSTKCSIVLDAELVDISRQHLVIERYPDLTLHFTDLSSSGTQLPSDRF